MRKFEGERIIMVLSINLTITVGLMLLLLARMEYIGEPLVFTWDKMLLSGVMLLLSAAGMSFSGIRMVRALVPERCQCPNYISSVDGICNACGFRLPE